MGSFCQDLECKEGIVHLLSECPGLERNRFQRLSTRARVEMEEFRPLSVRDLKSFITVNTTTDRTIICLTMLKAIGTDEPTFTEHAAVLRASNQILAVLH